jgi:hypothetical protein
LVLPALPLPGLVDRPDGFHALGRAQREQALLASQEDRADEADPIAAGAEAGSGAGQRGLEHCQLVIVDLRQPAFDNEKTGQGRAGRPVSADTSVLT